MVTWRRPRSRWASRVHLVATVVWVLLVVPTLLWWRSSIWWIALMSIWSNVASHWAAFQAARAEEAQR